MCLARELATVSDAALEQRWIAHRAATRTIRNISLSEIFLKEIFRRICTQFDHCMICDGELVSSREEAAKYDTTTIPLPPDVLNDYTMLTRQMSNTVSRHHRAAKLAYADPQIPVATGIYHFGVCWTGADIGSEASISCIIAHWQC